MARKKGKKGSVPRFAVRPILRDLWNSDDRAATEAAVHANTEFAGPNVYANAGVPVNAVIGTRLKGSPRSGAINPPSNTKYR